MPGIATQFEILRLTIDRLDAEGLTQFTQVMKANLPYAYLGAIGPSLGDFIPSDPIPQGTRPEGYSGAWKQIFGLMGTSPQGGNPGLYKTLKDLKGIIDELDKIAHDENVDVICALKDSEKYKEIVEAANALQTTIDVLKQTDRKSILGQIIQIIVKLRPKVCTKNKSDPVPPPDQWQVRDFLHWKKSGRFVKALIEKAKNTSDDRLLAYAYGYLISYTGQVCGAPFVNSTVGGSARTQWWRQRLAQNYIDAWVYGYYHINPRPKMNGDTPSPPYNDPVWRSLRFANLHQLIQLGSQPDPEELMGLTRSNQPYPKLLPDDFATHWFEAFQLAYSPPFPDSIKAEALNAAYVMVWLVLWFCTSNDNILCPDPNESMQPPNDCGAAPSALDPFKIDDKGNPTNPPPVEPDVDEDEAKKICAIFAAILGGLAALFGSTVLGGAAIAAGISMLDCDSLTVVNWKKLRCDLYWYRLYLYNGIKGFNKLLALTGFGYPLASELGTPKETLELLDNKEFQTGINLIKSKNFAQREDFPSKCWIDDYEFNKLDDFQYALEFLISLKNKFNAPPTSTDPGFESERAIAYLTNAYPSFFVDDDVANPLGNGDVKTGGSFPYRTQTLNNFPVQFGNAVANAVDLFKNLDKEFPNWNLDADRGLAYLTWQFKGFYDPDSVQIEPEP